MAEQYTMNIFPIRCMTCGNVLGRLESRYRTLYQDVLSGKITMENLMDQLGLRRNQYCCRQAILCQPVIAPGSYLPQEPEILAARSKREQEEGLITSEESTTAEPVLYSTFCPGVALNPEVANMIRLLNLETRIYKFGVGALNAITAPTTSSLSLPPPPPQTQVATRTAATVGATAPKLAPLPPLPGVSGLPPPPTGTTKLPMVKGPALKASPSSPKLPPPPQVKGIPKTAAPAAVKAAPVKVAAPAAKGPLLPLPPPPVAPTKGKTG